MKRTKRRLCLAKAVTAALANAIACASAFADFDAGKRAFDNGAYDRARAEWSAAAIAGDGRSQLSLGKLFDDGTGVRENNTQAHFWYALAAINGLEAADTALAEIEIEMSADEIDAARMLSSRFAGVFATSTKTNAPVGSVATNQVDADSIDAETIDTDTGTNTNTDTAATTDDTDLNPIDATSNNGQKRVATANSKSITLPPVAANRATPVANPFAQSATRSVPPTAANDTTRNVRSTVTVGDGASSDEPRVVVIHAGGDTTTADAATDADSRVSEAPTASATNPVDETSGPNAADEAQTQAQPITAGGQSDRSSNTEPINLSAATRVESATTRATEATKENNNDAARPAGVVPPIESRDVLRNAAGTVPTDDPDDELRAKMRNLIRDVQTMLNDLGYPAGPADGVIGKKTREAVASFQRDNGLPSNGEIGPRTIRVLRSKS